MRNPTVVSDDVLGLVDGIAQCIDTSADVGKSLLDESDEVLAILGELRLDILDLGDDFVKSPRDRAIKQKVANIAYEIAKVTIRLTIANQGATGPAQLIVAC
jgi:hypothetical protein